MLKNSLLFLISILFAFLLCEISLRILGFRGEIEWTMANAIPVNDKILNYRLQPNSVSFTGDITYRLNSNGYRDIERSYKKAINSYRILVIGDSVAYGYKVKFEDIFSRKLQAMLDKYYSDRKIEALNLAIPGTNTLQEGDLLRNEGSRYNPDMTIILFVLNDADIGAHYKVSEKKCRIEMINMEIPCSVKRTVKKLALPYLIKDRIDNMLWHMRVGDNDDVFNSIKSDYFTNIYMKESNWKNHIVDGFKMISEFAEKGNIPTILVIFPIMFDFDNYKWSWIHDKIAREGEKHHFYMVDLLEEYRKYPVNRTRVERGDFVHPNRFGHHLAASAVFKLLSENPHLRLE